MYRGINCNSNTTKEQKENGQTVIDNYEPGVVGTFSQFSSTSMNKAKAMEFAHYGMKKDDVNNKDISFFATIYLTDNNFPST